MLGTRREMDNYTQECVKKLKKEKEKIVQVFEEMIQDVTDQISSYAIEDEIVKIDKNLEEVRNIVEKTNKTKTIPDEILSKLETVRALMGDISLNSSGPRSYEYPDYTKSTEPVATLVGELTMKEMLLTLSGPRFVTEDTCALFQPVHIEELRGPRRKKWKHRKQDAPPQLTTEGMIVEYTHRYHLKLIN